MVTTDDGYRPFRKVWDDIPADLRANRRVVFATSDGAAIFHGGAEGELVEDKTFGVSGASALAAPGNDEPRIESELGQQEVAQQGSCPLRLPTASADMDALVELCRGLYIRLLEDLAAKPDLLSALDRRTRSGYEKILQTLKDSAPEREAQRSKLEEVLSPEALAMPGAILGKGTMLWFNQAGPIEGWIREGGDKDPYFGFYSKTGTQPAYTNLFLMGLPQQVSKPYIGEADFAAGLARLGLCSSAAPNSVCIRSRAVSKDLPLQWLSQQPQYEFSFSSAIAFGDNPLGNDGPLASLPLPFVSVAPEHPGGPPPGCEEGGFYHVGGCEAGTAAVVELLLEALRSQREPAVASASEAAALHRQLPELCARAAETLIDSAGDGPHNVASATAAAPSSAL